MHVKYGGGGVFGSRAHSFFDNIFCRRARPVYPPPKQTGRCSFAHIFCIFWGFPFSIHTTRREVICCMSLHAGCTAFTYQRRNTIDHEWGVTVGSGSPYYPSTFLTTAVQYIEDGRTSWRTNKRETSELLVATNIILHTYIPNINELRYYVVVGAAKSDARIETSLAVVYNNNCEQSKAGFPLVLPARHTRHHRTTQNLRTGGCRTLLPPSPDKTLLLLFFRLRTKIIIKHIMHVWPKDGTWYFIYVAYIPSLLSS